MGGVHIDGPPLHARDHLPDGPDPIDFPASRIEWIYYESNTDWDEPGDLTPLEFTFQNGSYDEDTPTFDLSAVPGNPQIKKHGHYQILVAALNFSAGGAGTEQAVIRMDMEKVSGPTPLSWRSWATASSPLVNNMAGYWSTVPITMWPGITDFLVFAPSVSFATPFTMKIEAWKLINGTVTAENDVVVRLAIQRLGDSYS